jgi:hypothetical protein
VAIRKVITGFPRNLRSTSSRSFRPRVVSPRSTTTGGKVSQKSSILDRKLVKPQVWRDFKLTNLYHAFSSIAGGLGGLFWTKKD